MLRLVLIAGAASLMATASFAAPEGFQAAGAPEPTTNSSSTADPSATDPDKVICKNVKPPTGTRLASSRSRQRICQTKADWEQQEAEAQEAARNARNGPSASGNENSRQPG